VDTEAPAAQVAQDCLQAASETGDQWGIAKAQQFLALKALEDGDYATTESLAQQALNVFEASGDKWSKSVLCIEVLGLLALSLQQYDTAKQWIRHGLSAAEAIGFKYSIQTAYWQLGFVAVLENNYAEAAQHWRSALNVAEHNLFGQSVIGFGGSKSSAAWGGRKLVAK
jgi:tetratricopeptide (TPR) repeat protein